MDLIFYTVLFQEIGVRFQVSGKVDAIAYPEHGHLKPCAQKEE